MLYQTNAPGDWGIMENAPGIQTATETLAMADGCKLFLRSWLTDSKQVLLLMHGLGAHSGWFIDMGNSLARLGLTVYCVDHRGFGRSEGLPGHVERFQNYIEDLATLLQEIRRRHPDEGTRFFVLGHSMGGIFATYLAAQHSDLLDGVLFLNPWVQDQAKVPLSMTLRIFTGGLAGSKRLWSPPGGAASMTTNQEAIKMLEADTYWRRQLTANFLVQIFRMRMQMLKYAARITIPALVLQAEQDKSVILAASQRLYRTLGSQDKTWTTYPGYAHDTQLEADRSMLDKDIVEWIQRHAS